MKLFSDHVHWSLSYLDPCDRMICNGTNAMCQVIYETGKPFCTCDKGFTGDPSVNCGMYCPS